MLEHALRYKREYGWNVIPIWWVFPNGRCACGRKHDDPKDVGKHPILPWKEWQTKEVTEEQIEDWWGRWPQANIAAISGFISGVALIDDDQSGGSSERYNTLCSCTGGGGHHFLFSLNGKSIPCRNRIDDHTDVKGEGGYFLLPPSTHRSGKPYHWVNDKPMIPFPEEVRRLLVTSKPSQNGGALQDGVHTEGSRNDAMMREVCTLFGKGLTPQEVLTEIRKWNQEWNFPPSPDHELIACVKSIWNNQEKPKRLQGRPDRRSSHQTGALNILTTEQMALKYGGKEQTWLIPHWLPAATCCIVGAPPETFKTWTIFDLAVSLTTGKPFLSRYPVQQTGPVLIVQQEDNFTMTIDRLTRLIALGQPTEELFPFPPAMLPHWTDDRMLHVENEMGMRQLREFIERIRPIAVIIDPMNSFIPLSEDFGTLAAQLINTKLKTLRDEFGTTFVLLHHTNKHAIAAESKGSRKRDSLWGSNFLNANLETGWHLRCPVEGGNIVEIQRHTKQAGHEPDIRVRWHITDWTCRAEVL